MAELQVKFFKGTEAQYTSGKTTYDANGTIFFCTDKPYIYVGGVKYGTTADELNALLTGVADVKFNAANNQLTISYVDGTAAETLTLISYTGKEAITVTGTGTSKEIALKIAEANKILSQSANGLLATLSFKDDSENKKIQLIGNNNAVVDEFSYEKFIVDGMLDDVKLQGNNLVFTFNTAAGKKTIDPVDLSKYIDTYEEGDGIEIDDHTISVKVKTNDKYIEVTEAGVASKGIDTAIEAAVKPVSDKVDAIDVAGDIEDALAELELETVGGTGKVVTTIAQEDGKVTATAIDLTAANVKATAVAGSTEVTVQGILGDLANALVWHTV